MQPVQQPRARHGLAVAALVLGILAVLFGTNPITFVVDYPLAILAIVFGALGLRWGLGKAGLILGVVGLVLAILWSAFWGSVASDVNDQLTATHTVTVDITGTGNASIGVSSSAGDSTAPHQLPYHQELTSTGLDMVTVTADADDLDTTLTCTIKVDGVQKETDTAAGMVTCVVVP